MSAAAAAADVTIEFGDDGRIRPHGGGKLVDLRAPASAAAGLKAACNHTLELTDRQACDVELLSVGAFTPLEGFMNEDAYASVLAKMRLPSGALFGLPVVLDAAHDGVKPGDKVLLTHRGQDLAVMAVESRWRPNKAAEAAACYGSTSRRWARRARA
jgi:sulfate adenylyltransferase